HNVGSFHTPAIVDSAAINMGVHVSLRNSTPKMWYIYTMEYYLAIRKNEILPFATTWMELEGIMLSEISQSEKNKNHMTSPI
uniref:Uncharacterized protein n=1 Tax=Lynx canadensis TaxID=61383 RepID=A0A667HME4_LYNCA